MACTWYNNGAQTSRTHSREACEPYCGNDVHQKNGFDSLSATG